MPSSKKDSQEKQNRTKGREFEKLAGKFYLDLGFEILETNWQAGRKEIDIIVKKDKLIVFVEVKSASSKKYGHPSERVDKRKIANLSIAANQFILENNLTGYDMRFDVVTYINGKIEHYPNAFNVAE